MIKKMGFGIVGCGTISDIHAQAILASDRAELVSVFSRSAKNAERVGKKYSVPFFTEWEKFIANDKVEIISICTPNGNHLDYARKVAEAGKHVVVEKPIEVTVRRGKQIIVVCQKNGVRLAVIFQNRFLPATQKIRQAIEADQLGKIFHGSAYVKWYRDQVYYDSGLWRGTLEMDGGGCLINQSIHTIDLLQWFMGEVESVYGQTGIFAHKNIEGEDDAAALLRFKSGAIGLIESSTSIQPAMDRKIEIHGEKGTATLTGDSVNISIGQTSTMSEKEKQKGSGAASPLAGFSIGPHQRQFEAIVHAISNNEDPPVTGKDSLKSLAIVEAIYKSAKTGLPVKMEELV
jgi:predicted dehydrogenase